MTGANTYGRQVVTSLTNKSGGGVIAGDVVIVGTANNDAFTTTTSAAFTGTIGIAQDTIADNATGRVLLSGYAALINTTASVTRQNFGTTSTTVKKAVDAGASRIAGTFCQFLTGGTTPDAIVYPSDLGAGSGASTTAVYIEGQGGQADTGNTNRVVIPGFSASPDIRVAATNDDEFDTTSSAPPTGWTALGSPTTSNANTQALSHYYVKKSATGTYGLHGIYKAAPSLAFTVTAKLSDVNWRGADHAAGLMVGTATPGTMATIGVAYSATALNCNVQLTTPTAFGSNVITYAMAPQPPCYLRIVATTSTNVAYYISYNGFLWQPVTTAHNPGITVASAGLWVTQDNATYDIEALFDWIRFT